MMLLKKIFKRRVNYWTIKKIGKQLVKLMQEKHPGANYTIWIHVWQDDTYQVICRSGSDVTGTQYIERDYKWYNGEITYEEHIKEI